MTVLTTRTSIQDFPRGRLPIQVWLPSSRLRFQPRPLIFTSEHCAMDRAGMPLLHRSKSICKMHAREHRLSDTLRRDSTLIDPSPVNYQ